MWGGGVSSAGERRSMQIGEQHSEMEGGGLYNAHSRPQASAGELGIPLLQRAALEVPHHQGCIGVADLGCSQGKNSMSPMRAAIASLRSRDAAAAVTITHTDLPANDFNALFGLIGSSPESYLREQHNVYAFAAGGSFYAPLFAPCSIDLAWNSIAVHWLSGVPCDIPGHIWSPFAQGQVRDAFAQRGAEDWRSFSMHARANCARARNWSSSRAALMKRDFPAPRGS